MSNRCLYLFTLLLLFIVPTAAAQTIVDFNGVQHKITRYTAADGLPSDRIYTVVDDPQGLIWIGTDGGLSRFDGHTFTNYVPIEGDTTSISSINIHAIHVDGEGDLYAASGILHPRGLNKFDPQTEIFQRFTTDSSFPGNLVRSMQASKVDQNILWLGLLADSKEFICKFDTSTDQVMHCLDRFVEQYGPFEWVTSIIERRDGGIWLGMLEYAGVNTGLYRVSADERDIDYYLEDQSVWALYEDNNHELWVGTEVGLYKIDENDRSIETFIAPVAGRINALFEDSKNNFWVAVENKLFLFDKDSGRFNPYPIEVTNYYIESIYEDRFGVLWISGFSELIRIKRIENPFFNGSEYSDEIFNRARTALKDIKGNLWLAATEEILIMSESGEVIHRLEEPLVTDMFQDSWGDIWVSTACNRHELIRYVAGDVEDRKMYKHDPGFDGSIGLGCVNPLFEDQSGNLWVASYSGTNFGGGINLFNRQTESFKRYHSESYDIKSNSILRINAAESEEDVLWISAEEGIIRFDVKNESFTNYFSELLLRSMMVHEDRNQRLWVATAGNGLQLFDREKGKVERTYTTKDGLAHNQVYSVYEDKEGYLWMSTKNGLSRFDPETEIFRNFYRSNGLPIQAFEEYGKYQSVDGELFFGRPSGGVFSFYPEDIKDTSIESEMHLTNFQINGVTQKPSKTSPLKQSIRLAESIRLPYNQNDVTIDYVGIQPTSPELQKYRYKLEGFDEGWIEAGQQRSARYSLIPAGDYTFRVTAANADGVWSSNEAQLAIKVLPPWWRSVYAFAVYGLLLVVGGIGVDRVQRRRVIRKERERTRDRELAQAKEIEQAYTQLKTTQQQLVQQEKMASLGQLTSGIAHEIKNPLNFVNNFAHINENLVKEILQAKEEDPEEFEELLTDLRANTRQIKKHGARADRIVRNMMEHAASTEGSRYDVQLNTLVEENISLAYSSFQAQHPDTDIRIERNLSDDVGTLNIVPQDIGRVLQNILKNAFEALIQETTNNKQQTTNGIVTVSTSKASGAVEIRIKDNGLGIPEAIRDKIFEPFFTTKPTGTGTGLGLSLSYDIITQGHNGMLEVESKEGEGAEFVIRLPGK